MPKKSSKRLSNGAAKPDLATEISAKPTSEEIAHRAYELFLREGGQHGHDLEHWLEAEREILDRSGVAT